MDDVSASVMMSRVRAALSTLQSQQADLTVFQRALEGWRNENVNAPTEAAKLLLNRFGFAVLHRAQLVIVEQCLAATLANADFEFDEERERLQALLRTVRTEMLAAEGRGG